MGVLFSFIFFSLFFFICFSKYKIYQKLYIDGNGLFPPPFESCPHSLCLWFPVSLSISLHVNSIKIYDVVIVINVGWNAFERDRACQCYAVLFSYSENNTKTAMCFSRSYIHIRERLYVNVKHAIKVNSIVWIDGMDAMDGMLFSVRRSMAKYEPCYSSLSLVLHL